MSITEQRLAANRANALKSTGPRSPSGKARASRNAGRHGILANRLLMEDECPIEFDNIFTELQAALSPVGFMEMALVERIAVGLWRQRRLVTAETSATGLSRMMRKIAVAVTNELGLGCGSELNEEDLGVFDRDRAAWCKAVIAEVEKLGQIDPVSLPQNAPTIFEQLKTDAEDELGGIEVYLQARQGGLTAYVAELIDWCREQLKMAEQHPQVLALAEQVKARRLVLPDDALEVFSRYQTTLDNQLYKALRALREAQEWRLKTLDSAVNRKAGQLDVAA